MTNSAFLTPRDPDLDFPEQILSDRVELSPNNFLWHQNKLLSSSQIEPPPSQESTLRTVSSVLIKDVKIEKKPKKGASACINGIKSSNGEYLFKKIPVVGENRTSTLATQH